MSMSSFFLIGLQFLTCRHGHGVLLGTNKVFIDAARPGIIPARVGGQGGPFLVLWATFTLEARADLSCAGSVALGVGQPLGLKLRGKVAVT